MMERLAQHYFDQGQWTEVIAAYHSLIANNANSDNLCLYQARVAEATRRGQPRDRQVLELRRAVDLMNTFLRSEHPNEARNTCRQEVAQLVVDVATSWHQEAVGTDTAPGTSDEETMELASAVYQIAIDEFEDLDALDLEGWPDGQGPTVYRLIYWDAELLWSRRQWAECGPAFDRVVRMNPEGEYLRDAAYSAVLCYDNLFRDTFGDEGSRRVSTSVDDETDIEELRQRPLTDQEQAMIRAFDRYVCHVTEDDDLARVKFRRAIVYYEARQFEEAAVLFGDVATSAPADDLAPLAAQLQVDSYNALRRLHPDRAIACEDAIDDAARGYLADTHIGQNEEIQSLFQPLLCGIQWSRAERRSGIGDFRECADLYLGIYRDYREACQQIGEHTLDEVLYNAAICLESDYRIGQAIQVRRRLIEEFGMGSEFEESNGRASRWSAQAEHQIAGNYHAIAAYTKAAEHYERFARRYPGEDEAPEALRTATVFWMGLGQHDRALENAAQYERSYGRRHKADTARVVGAVGSIYITKAQWPQAEDHYRSLLKRYGSGASPDELISARVNLGYALWRQEGRKAGGAVREFRQALVIADRGRPDGGRETVGDRLARYRRMLFGDVEDEGADFARRLVRMVDAVAKARFYLAEGAFERFASIELPPFRTSNRLSSQARAFWISKQGREEAIRWEQGLRFLSPDERLRQLAHVQFEHWASSELTPWVRQRDEARASAERIYSEVVSEDVPEWEIAAAARIGEMVRVMMQSFYDVPIPPLVRDDEELRAIFEEELDRAAMPYREAAIDAYEHCLNEATENRWFNEWSRDCELQLNRLSPRDYPIADEFRTAPGHSGSPLAIPQLVETLNNTGDNDIEVIPMPSGR